MNPIQEEIEIWEAELNEAQASGDENYAELAGDLLAELRVKHRLYQRLIFAWKKDGPGLELKGEHSYCIVLHDASVPGAFRYQVFREDGFLSHHTRPTIEEVLLAALDDGYCEPATGSLVKFSGTPAWDRGNFVNDLIMQVNMGSKTLSDANRELERYAA